ncbi:MAG TPA: hypothetical protein VFX34_09850 [Sporosarcina sp.]|uniref:Tumour necrosis factor receptor superfamily member 19 n=1 Tax=Sporosarcina koreensis TaxID=334735 RepID=A0ABW0TSU1_9BACL|nr:hypothetical protein [Sporosarcina sp.]
MKGKTLVIGLVVFVLAVVAVIYFAMTAQFDKDRQEDGVTTTIVD